MSVRDRGARPSGGSLVPVLLLVLLSSLVTSGYVLTVGRTAQQGRGQESVDRAALSVASDLAAINFEHPRLGRIGLCDSSASGQRVYGINNLIITARVNMLLSDQAGLPEMRQFARNDLEEILKSGEQLRELLHQCVLPNFIFTGGDGRTYRPHLSAHSIISGAARAGNETLSEVTIELGRLNKPRATTTPAPDSEVDAQVPEFTKGGRCLSGVDIPTPGMNPLRLVDAAGQATLVPADQFAAARDAMPPSVVRIRATFLVKRGDGPLRQLTRTASAIVGAPYLRPSPSSFLLSFPHGSPAGLTTLRQLFAGGLWQKGGDWLQAVNASVPGQGYLAPPLGIDTAGLRPEQSLALSFYHFLRQCGPELKLSRVNEMLDRPWPEGVAGDGRAWQQNSALTRDTGARLYVLANQSGPGGTGQSLLREAFRAELSERAFPPSALPLIIDSNGNCHMSGRTGLPLSLVRQFVTALSETNLAAMETRSVAKQVLGRMDHAIKQLNQDLFTEREELRSIERRLSRLAESDRSDSAGEAQRQRNLSRRQAEKIEEMTRRLKEYNGVRERAQQAVRNAESAWAATYELAGKLSEHARCGLFAVGPADSPCMFIFGTSVLFAPMVQPVAEDEIYGYRRAARSSPEASPDGSRTGDIGTLSWTSPRFAVVSPPPPELSVDRSSAAEPVRARFLTWYSEQLIGTQPVEARQLAATPFGRSGIGRLQLCYYAPDALLTGGEPRVAWSLLVRDNVAFRCEGAGEPLPPDNSSWCVDRPFSFESCPGLACEVQIRAPVPLVKDLSVAPSVVSPSMQERLSLIPPTPPTMF